MAGLVNREDDSLTPNEINVLILIERIGGGLSMLGIVLIAISYWAYPKLRTTPNLFLLFASIANAGASVASMIGYDGVHKGESSGLCQAQGFIFEWCMQADPWWSFAMAINVFLVFFCNANPRSFRKYAWAYCIVCFGGPMIPAIVLICINDPKRGLVYGDASLWCWIGAKWSILRLYSYYIPIWVCLFFSIMIYIAVGHHVFHHRNQLRNLASEPWDNEEKRSSSTGSILRASDEDILNRPEIYGTAVTEVQIISNPQSPGIENFLEAPSTIQSRILPEQSTTWETSRREAYHEHDGDRNRRFETVCSSDRAPQPPLTMISRLRAAKSNASLKLKGLDPVKMAYLRTSFIFGLSVLITWIPSSINRIYSLAHHNEVSFGLSVASGCVLPLQGVWNAVIFYTTSWDAFREEFNGTMDSWFNGRKCPIGARRLESRLDAQQGERRDTFDRAQIRSCQLSGDRYGITDIELEDRSGLADDKK